MSSKKKAVESSPEDTRVFDEFAGIDPYDRDFGKLDKLNKGFIPGFKAYLKEQGYNQHTIDIDVDNMEFYFSQLSNRLGYTMPEGASSYAVDEIIGYVYVYKFINLSVSDLKQAASSTLRFYKYAYMKGYISKEEWKDVRNELKKMLPQWIQEVKRY